MRWAEIGADYNGRRPNCNATFGPFRTPDAAQILLRLQGLAGLAKGARCSRKAGIMAKRAGKSSKRSGLAKRTARSGTKGGTKRGARNGARDNAVQRIAAALERLTPPPPPAPDFTAADAFTWHPIGHRLAPVPHVSRVSMSLLKGIDRVRDLLLENTERFAKALPANNALLWGARGMGKSSLVKAVHADVNGSHRGTGSGTLKLVEIHREDIESLPDLMNLMRGAPYRFILFCDDLSFEATDTSYKSLKAVLEGGIEGRPSNVVFYATSNRRHLMAREMMENERQTAINPGEAVEEKVSLSDRFGLWLGFHRCSQDEYLAMVQGYVAHFGIPVDGEELEREALEWATTRGARSGRVAWQYVQDVAGRLGVTLTEQQSR
jgi:predicted AAA+ superfamily ATPase